MKQNARKDRIKSAKALFDGINRRQEAQPVVGKEEEQSSLLAGSPQPEGGQGVEEIKDLPPRFIWDGPDS